MKRVSFEAGLCIEREIKKNISGLPPLETGLASHGEWAKKKEKELLTRAIRAKDD